MRSYWLVFALITRATVISTPVARAAATAEKLATTATIPSHCQAE
jgi:hypothetical protein